MIHRFHRHRHQNLLFVFLGLLIAFSLSTLPQFNNFILHLGKLGYLSAFLAGMLFASTFTVTVGGLILLALTQVLPLVVIVFLGGLGALFADILIFFFVRRQIENEIAPIYEHFFKHSHLKKILHTRYFSWTLPVLGVFIIASPLPDELGVSLLGLSAMNITEFSAISFLSHTLGILSIISVGKLFT